MLEAANEAEKKKDYLKCRELLTSAISAFEASMLVEVTKEKDFASYMLIVKNVSDLEERKKNISLDKVKHEKEVAKPSNNNNNPLDDSSLKERIINLNPTNSVLNNLASFKPSSSSSSSP